MVARRRRERELRRCVAYLKASLRRHQVVSGEGQTHGAARTTFECAMHGAGVTHKVRTRPWMPLEEIEREHTALESITGTAGRHEIAGVMRSAARQREYMVERRAAMIETQRAVHAALAAVPQSGATHGLFLSHMRRHVRPPGPK